MDQLRIGALGAARITPPALLAPAAERDSVVVTTVAARDRDRAEAFAAEHGIDHVAADYDEIFADPDIDAVYNALPPSEHLRWSLAALDAGKHVLCEKPITANAAEARILAAAAERSGLVVMEAFHWRYHPLAERMIEIVESGRLGTIDTIEAVFTVAIPDRSNIRHSFDLAGGSLMDLGCYPVQWIRALVDGEPEVISARAVEGAAHIDAFLEAELALPGGATATLRTGMEDVDLARYVTVTGSDGRLQVENPLAPQAGHWIQIDDEARETVDGDTTYGYQLDAFVEAVRNGGPVLTDAADGVRNMELIDSIYAATGLPGAAPIPASDTRPGTRFGTRFGTRPVTRFDHYVAVDWSAAARPATGANSVWVGHLDAATSARPTLRNPPTRGVALSVLIELCAGAIAAGERVIVGLDAGFGYPHGTLDALGCSRWSDLWAMIEREIEDDDDTNANNRFTVAAALNQRIGTTAGPFWAAPVSAVGPGLAPTRGAFPYPADLAGPTATKLSEYRRCEAQLRAAGHRVQSVWKLFTAGSVGGQTLLAIARLQRLRHHRVVGPHVSIWPYETDQGVLDRRPTVIVTEMWPGALGRSRTDPGHDVLDAAQVDAAARRLAELDASGELDDLLLLSALHDDDATVARQEEGWILGAESPQLIAR